jgi:hypothetical protein
MTTIKPEGAMLIVFPLPKEESTTEGGIVTQDFALVRASVEEVSDEWESKIPRGSVVLFADSDGVGKSINYKKKSCLWVSGKAFGEGGDLFGIEVTDKK